jgi:hypothetical protein
MPSRTACISAIEADGAVIIEVFHGGGAGGRGRASDQNTSAPVLVAYIEDEAVMRKHERASEQNTSAPALTVVYQRQGRVMKI